MSTPSSRPIARLPALAALLLAALPAAAQESRISANLLANPDFDTDLSGWTLESHADLRADWDERNYLPNQASGSLKAKSVDSEASGYVAWQCLSVEPGAIYDFGAHARAHPENEANSAYGAILVNFPEVDGGCTGTGNWSTSRPFAAFNPVDATWVSTTRGFTVPANRTQVRIGVAIDNATAGTVTDDHRAAAVDHVWFGRQKPLLRASLQVPDTTPPQEQPFEIVLGVRSEGNSARGVIVEVAHGGRLHLVSESCPGTVTDIGTGSQRRLRWSGMSTVGADAVACPVTVRAELGPQYNVALAMTATSTDGVLDAASATAAFTLFPQPVADAFATLTMAPTVPEPGGTVTVSLDYGNAGSAPGSMTFQFQVLPAWQRTASTCALQYLEEGIWGLSGNFPVTSYNCAMTFSVPEDYSGRFEASMSGTVHFGGPDPMPGNDSATAEVQVALLRVNRTPDGFDRAPGDGVCEQTAGIGDCSLRAAVMEANALGGRRTIEIPFSASPYLLDRTDCNDDEVYCGDVDVRKPMILRGEPNANGERPIVQGAFPAGSPARLFSIATGSSSSTIVEQLVLAGQNIAIPTTDGDGHGGLVHHGSGELVLRDLVLRHGRAANLRRGGALYSAAGLVAERLDVHDNLATLGAGIAIDPSAFALVSVVDSHLHANTASTTAATGGGLAVRAPQALVGLNRIAVSGNTARFGGGIAVDNAPNVLLTNATVSGNEASSEGGGIHVSGSSLAISSSTIAYNAAAPASTTAGLGGGIFVSATSTAAVYNSILAYNTAQVTGTAPFLLPKSANCHGALSSSGYNSLSTTTSDTDCGFVAGTGDHMGVAPQLAALADNGGPTPTHALTAPGLEIDRGPPACDVFPGGSALLVDQRGRLRPADGDADGDARCDKGAYELSDSARITVDKAGAGTGSLSSNPNGLFCNSGCASVSAAFPYDTTVTITASAAPGSRFAGWEGDCASYGTAACVVDAAGHVVATARFELLADSYALDVAVSGGIGARVTSTPSGIDCPGSCSASFPASTEVSLHAEPGADNVLLGFYGSGCNGSASPCTFVMDRDRSITALFDIEEAGIAVTLAGNGVGRVTSAPVGIDCPGDCSNDYAIDESITLTAQAAVGSVFGGWSGACSGTSATCVLDMDLGPHAVGATFELSGTALFADGFE